MVAISVRMKTFCPIFLLPSLCFSTHFIALPLNWIEALGLHSSFSVGIPFNIGPFILLFVTKLFIPQSSFVGHLSGIIIGYPLAWNLLDWLTPPILLSLLAGLYMWKDELLVWKIPTFEQQRSGLVDFASFVPPSQLQSFNFLVVTSRLLYCAVPVSIFILGPSQITVRVVHGLLAWSALQGRRCEWILNGIALLLWAIIHIPNFEHINNTSGNAAHLSSQADIVSILILTGFYSYSMALYDLCNLAAAAPALGFLFVTSGPSSLLTSTWLALLSLQVAVEISHLSAVLHCLWEMRAASSVLARWGWDRTTVVKMLGHFGVVRVESAVVVPFSGRSHRLMGDHNIANSNSTTSNHNNNSNRGVLVI